MPSAANTAYISVRDPARAKPTAVPKNGAEQGVAKIVAKEPAAKLTLKFWCSSFVIIGLPAILLSQAGRFNSKKPNKLYANRLTMTVRLTINHGSWN